MVKFAQSPRQFKLDIAISAILVQELDFKMHLYTERRRWKETRMTDIPCWLQHMIQPGWFT